MFSSNTKARQMQVYYGENYGRKFLEIGCEEWGYNNAKNYTKDYTGVDVIDLKNKPKVFIKQDLEKIPKLPVKSGQFDLIIATDVIEHLFNRHEIMAEIKRLLKKNGTIIISLPNEYSIQPLWYHLKGVEWFSGGEHGHKFMYSINSAREFVEKHFDIVEEHYFYLDGKLEAIHGIMQWLAEKKPRWFARNILYKCKLKAQT